jgi:Zn-dependent M28 family amino/carboxypeptidase
VAGTVVLFAVGLFATQVKGAGTPASPLGSDTAPALTATAAAALSRTAEPPQQPATPTVDPTSSVEPTPPIPAVFSGVAAQKDVVALAKIGVRRSGGLNEHRAADYIAGRLRTMGYEPEVRTFKLPNGRTSRNVVARASGESTRVIVLGAHMDTKSPSPGANDNASGCAALLEIARNVADRPTYASVEFVFFGAEEMIDKNPDHHHYGSRRYVKSLSASQRKAVAAMISVDMIGRGSMLVSRTMGIGPKTLSNLLVRRAKAAGFKLSYLRDPSKVGWSDHEPFERIGIPVSWIEWRSDPYYHTTRDTAGRVIKARVQRAGQLVLDFVLDADEAMLAGLRK